MWCLSRCCLFEGFYRLITITLARWWPQNLWIWNEILGITVQFKFLMIAAVELAWKWWRRDFSVITAWNCDPAFYEMGMKLVGLFCIRPRRFLIGGVARVSFLVGIMGRQHIRNRKRLIASCRAWGVFAFNMRVRGGMWLSLVLVHLQLPLFHSSEGRGMKIPKQA